MKLRVNLNEGHFSRTEIADVDVLEITMVGYLKKYDDGHHFAHRNTASALTLACTIG